MRWHENRLSDLYNRLNIYGWYFGENFVCQDILIFECVFDTPLLFSFLFLFLMWRERQFGTILNVVMVIQINRVCYIYKTYRCHWMEISLWSFWCFGGFIVKTVCACVSCATRLLTYFEVLVFEIWIVWCCRGKNCGFVRGFVWLVNILQEWNECKFTLLKFVASLMPFSICH